ncbi:hypothetical protein LCGC14_0468490 [marine sediment metagenome]|uniref:Uncharacterized protein n=1 Tax=marine sediment metagenome TaxID=412755 RepID=A0A0F9VLR5_9ZZZZ
MNKAATKVAGTQGVEESSLLTRDDLRGRLLGTKAKPKIEMVTLFGEDVELRQPSFGSMLDAREIADTKTRTIEMIVQYAFVPGTNERIFEDTDRDVILGWPFGEDVLEIQNAIARLSGIDIEALEERLLRDPLSEQS